MKRTQGMLLGAIGILAVVLVVLLFVLPKQSENPSGSSVSSSEVSNGRINELTDALTQLESETSRDILNHPEAVALRERLMGLLNKHDASGAEEALSAYRQLLTNLVAQTSTTESSAASSESTSVSSHSDEMSSSSETSSATEPAVTLVVDVPTTDAYRIIVNKKHPLSPSYNPGENPVAKQAFLKLKTDMQDLGYAVSDNYSGFRSYDYQKQLYDNYVSRDGQANADRYSARPGYSEHQTGLAFDLIDTSGQLLGEGIDDGATAWLAENAHRYGFVVRYLSNKEHITGYMAETWHVRFVGNEAYNIYQWGLTLEEYYGVEGGDYRE